MLEPFACRLCIKPGDSSCRPGDIEIRLLGGSVLGMEWRVVENFVSFFIFMGVSPPGEILQHIDCEVSRSEL